MRNPTKWLVCTAALLFSMGVCADNHMHNLNITVTLSDNGSAHVEEVRQYTIDDHKHTEFYMPMNLPADMSLSAFSVEEDGEMMTDSTPWDIDLSRERKKGRYGIVDKGGNRYELCFGMGDNGDHTFRLRYIIGNMLRGYYESDGFNFMFYSRDTNEPPEQFTLTIRRDDGQPMDGTNVWAFGFGGEIQVMDSVVKAWSTQPLERQNHITIMIETPKGMFHPAVETGGDFGSVKQRAIEGSDYTPENDGGSGSGDGFMGILWQVGSYVLLFLACCLPSIYSYFKRRKWRKKLIGNGKDVPWQREIPCKKSLHRSNMIYTTLEGTENSKNLMGAYIMRMIYQGVLGVETVLIKNKQQPCLKIANPEQAGAEEQDDQDKSNMRGIVQILQEAAGENALLEPGEMKRYAKNKPTRMEKLYNALTLKKKIPYKTIDQKDALDVYGLKKFLEDFTLVKERHAVEVSLWNEYLVYATLYGNAKQVMKDFREICPEFYEQSELGKTMNQVTDFDVFVSSYSASVANAFTSAYSHNHPRSSGGGGSSSFGGGGGFSGGGFGGGSR